MKDDIPELIFPTRADFRAWLGEHGQTGEGVWLVFGKTKALTTLSANDALEEALCFGWIDGQIKSLDATKYRKYFTKRRAKSIWSDKNKGLVEALRAKGLMTEHGELAIATAKQNGTWDTPKGDPITAEQIQSLADKLAGRSPACENFQRMPPSVQRTYTARHLSFKSEEARQRDFEKIVDRLNQNLKPM